MGVKSWIQHLLVKQLVPQPSRSMVLHSKTLVLSTSATKRDGWQVLSLICGLQIGTISSNKIAMYVCLLTKLQATLLASTPNIRIQFLPPNTAAKLQPLDQGIIKSTKHNYRTILTTRYLAGVESKQEAKSIMKSFDFVVVCQVLVEAWDAVTPENIQKCFSKAGFMPMLSMSQSHMQSPPPPPPRTYGTICSVCLESCGCSYVHPQCGRFGFHIL